MDIMKISKEEYTYRRVQGIVGDQSFSIVLPKHYAVSLGIGKGDFVKVSQADNKIIIQKDTDVGKFEDG
jgi:hypothetical protein